MLYRYLKNFERFFVCLQSARLSLASIVAFGLIGRQSRLRAVTSSTASGRHRGSGQNPNTRAPFRVPFSHPRSDRPHFSTHVCQILSRNIVEWGNPGAPSPLLLEIHHPNLVMDATREKEARAPTLRRASAWAHPPTPRPRRT